MPRFQLGSFLEIVPALARLGMSTLASSDEGAYVLSGKRPVSLSLSVRGLGRNSRGMFCSFSKLSRHEIPIDSRLVG